MHIRRYASKIGRLDKKIMSELIERLIQESYDSMREQEVGINGDSVPMITLEDTTRKALEQLSMAYVSLGFEESKLGSAGLRMEIRRISAWKKTIRRLMEDIQEYRGRVVERAPELIEKGQESDFGIRTYSSGKISPC